MVSSHGGRGHWAVYFSSPQSFIITFILFIGLTAFGSFIQVKICAHPSQGGRRHWAVYYSSPQSFMITFFLLKLKYVHILVKGGGDIGPFITLVPKVYDDVFLIH